MHTSPSPCSHHGQSPLAVALLAAIWPALVLLTASTAYAAVPPPPSPLTLEAALDYAAEHAYPIQQARARVERQEGVVVETRARALPRLDASGEYVRFEPGTRVFGPDEYQDWTGRITLRQVVYAGGGIDAAISAERLRRQASVLALEAVLADTLLDVRLRFHEAVLARERVAVQEQNVSLLREQLQTVETRFSAGTVSNFEVTRARVTLANAQPGLIRARNFLRTASDELARAIGYQAAEAEAGARLPEPRGDLSYAPVKQELADALAAARARRPELRRLERLAQAGERGVRASQAGYLPTVTIGGGYEWNHAIGSNRWADTLNGWSGGARVDWPIFDGLQTAGRVRQARAALRETRLDLAETSLAVEVEVRRAISALLEAAELAEAAQQVVGQAEESLRLADTRFEAGSAQQLDVLQARNDLTQARLNQLEANFSYITATARLHRATGRTSTSVEPASAPAPASPAP